MAAAGLIVCVVVEMYVGRGGVWWRCVCGEKLVEMEGKVVEGRGDVEV